MSGRRTWLAVALCFGSPVLAGTTTGWVFLAIAAGYLYPPGLPAWAETWGLFSVGGLLGTGGTIAGALMLPAPTYGRVVVTLLGAVFAPIAYALTLVVIAAACFMIVGRFT